MRHDDKFRTIASKWIENAYSDLVIASMPIPEGVQHGHLCFHAQQAVEKSIKSLLILHRVDFPYTHNIQSLLELLAECMEVPETMRDAIELSPYASQTRYPEELPELSQEDLDRAIHMADRVFKWASEIVKKQ